MIKDWVVKDKKMIGGGGHRRLKLRARRICEEEYGRKWREELQWKVRNLEKKFSKIVPEEDEGIIEGLPGKTRRRTSGRMWWYWESWSLLSRTVSTSTWGRAPSTERTS